MSFCRQEGENDMDMVQGVRSKLGEKEVLSMFDWDCLTLQGKKNRKQSGDNAVVLEFSSKSQNEGFARMVAAAYAAQLNPTLEELADIKTAVSEAVTNAIIHGYDGREGIIRMKLSHKERVLSIEVSDQGVGMENVLKAMEPMYTTRPDMERSGMGFAFMEAFMDELEVHSRLGYGTVVRMEKEMKSLVADSD